MMHDTDTINWPKAYKNVPVSSRVNYKVLQITFVLQIRMWCGIGELEGIKLFQVGGT